MANPARDRYGVGANRESDEAYRYFVSGLGIDSTGRTTITHEPEACMTRGARFIRWRGLLVAVLVSAIVWVVGSGAGHGNAQSLRTAAADGPPAPRAYPTLTLPMTPVGGWQRIPVLMYHRVVAPGKGVIFADGYNVPPNHFAAQMQWLQVHGFHPISQIALFDALAFRTPLPSRPIVLTFDDGYVDAVHSVLPVLVNAQRHWPAAFFVITGRIGEGQFLRWDQIHQLELAGMDIGSHTVHHVALGRASRQVATSELVRSAEVLARGLGHPVYWIAYPYGSVTSAVAHEAADAGYLLAYTTHPGMWLRLSMRTMLPRIDVAQQDSLRQFAALVTVASGANSAAPIRRKIP